MLHSNSKKIKTFCRVHNKKLGSFYQDLMSNQGITNTTDKEQCDLFMPTTQQEFESITLPENAVISTIDNINEINRKHALWHNLVKRWGRFLASQIIPESFNILRRGEMKRFANDYLYKDATDYILKNEQESARGILVSNNIKEMTAHIVEKKDLGYPVTVIQKIVKSYLVAKHVFKMRMFLLIKCDKGGHKHFYLHKEGGIFYAPHPYNKHRLTNDTIIANGYWYNNIAPSDYLGFINDKPKNLGELYRYLDNEGFDSKRMVKRIIDLLILIFKAIEDKIFIKNRHNEQFCILGFDVMIDENRKPWIIEFNKGPSTKSYNDVNVFDSKNRVWGDMMNLVNGEKNHNWVEVYAKK